MKIDRQTLILAEQVRGLYGSTAAIAFGGLALPPFITVLFWDVMDHPWSMVWVVMVALTAGAWAIVLNRQFLRHNHLPHDWICSDRWIKRRTLFFQTTAFAMARQASTPSMRSRASSARCPQP